MKKLALLLLLITGCAAEMVAPPGSGSSSFAPVNEASRPGTVKYLNAGAPGVIASRRENAYEQMYRACRGKYRIISEGPRAEGGVANQWGSTQFYSSNEYWYINFACVSD